MYFYPMMKSKMKLLTLPIEKIIPYEFNNKDHKEYDVDEIVRSVKKVGVRDPLEVDENFVLLSGHGRLLAFQKMWIKEVFAIQYTDMTEDQKMAYRILTNRTNDLSVYNLGNLQHELGILNDPWLNDLFKWFKIELDQEDLNIENEDTAPIPQENKPVVKAWDIFQLWNHTLLCWDATQKESYDTLLKWATADIIFTDPPYNINYKWSGKKTSKGIKNDNMDQNSFLAFLTDSFHHLSKSTLETGAWYIFHSHKTQKTFEQALNTNSVEVLYQLIRNKPSVNHVGWDYKQKHEPFFYCGKKWQKPKFYGDIYDATVLDFHGDKTDQQLLKEIKKAREAETIGKTTIRSMKRHNVQDYEHPTQKPVGLVTYALQNSSTVWSLVLDPFWWSGTTLIASEKIWRRCAMMELDPKYIEVIIVRYREFTRWKKEIKCLNRKLEIKTILQNI